MTTARFPWGALLLAAVVGWVFVHTPSVGVAQRGPGTWRERYPESAAVDLDFLRRVAEAREANREADLDTDRRGGRLPIGTARNAAATALHRLLARSDEPPAPFRIDALIDDSDLGAEPWNEDVVQLRDHGTPTTDAAVLRAANDRALRADIREQFVQALVRPGWRQGFDVAAGIATNPDADPALRRTALLRLADFELPVPAAVRNLIRDPFGDWSHLAAVALAAGGDAEAPSLVRAQVRQLAQDVAGDRGTSRRTRTLAARAAQTVSRNDPEVTRATQRMENEEAGAVTELSEALDAWLDAHPEAFDTEHERSSAQDAGLVALREAWLRRTPEEILALPDDALDPAAAAAVLTLPAAEAADALERLDRLAAWVADEVREPSPEQRIARIEELLTPQFTTASVEHVRAVAAAAGLLGPPDYRPSSLDWLFQRRAGNCLGWTTVWLGIAHRTGLPLRAVTAPSHMFVRWDSPALRFNVEPTSLGARPTDDDYRRSHAIDAELERGGRELRSLSAREFISLACSNAADEQFGGPRAGPLADLAILFDPANAYGRIVRARLRLPSSSAHAADDVESALAGGPLGLGALVGAANLLRDAGRLARAAELTAEAVRRWPAGQHACVSHAEILVALGRPSEALEVMSAARRGAAAANGAAAADRRAATPSRAWLVEIHARSLLGDPTWRRQLAEVDRAPLEAPWFRTTLAERLLASAGRPADHARDAVEVLAPLADLERATDRGFGRSVLPPAHPGDAERQVFTSHVIDYRRVLADALERTGDSAGAARVRAEPARGKR